MSKTRKSTSPSAVQVKNQRKAISNEEKLDAISRLEKGEHIVDICRNVRFAHITLCKIRDNVNRSKETAKSVLKCLCSKTTTVLLQ
jgi:DNA-binding transcriptional ArsR family regulator